MAILLVLLLIGATLRITRLLTSDYLLEGPRAWLCDRLANREKIVYLIRCDWCLSAWVGVAVFVFGWYAPDPLVWITSGALTASYLAGWSVILYSAVEAMVWDDE